MCWTQFKTIGHSSKNLGPSQKTSSPLLVPQAGYGPGANPLAPTFFSFIFAYFFRKCCLIKSYKKNFSVSI